MRRVPIGDVFRLPHVDDLPHRPFVEELFDLLIKMAVPQDVADQHFSARFLLSSIDGQAILPICRGGFFQTDVIPQPHGTHRVLAVVLVLRADKQRVRDFPLREKAFRAVEDHFLRHAVFFPRGNAADLHRVRRGNQLRIFVLADKIRKHLSPASEAENGKF